MSLKKAIFKKIYKIHVYLGLFIAIHVAIFSISGLILLFKDEIQKNEKSQKSPLVHHEKIAKQFEAIQLDLLKNDPQDRILALFPDDENQNLIHVRLGIDGATQLRGARKLMYDLVTTQKLNEKPITDPHFFDLTLELHRELFLGSKGKLYIGFVGLLYAILLITGFLIYGNFMRGRSFGEIRHRPLVKWMDWHKFIGVITFGWTLIVALSGVFLAFNGVLIKLFQKQSLKTLTESYHGFDSSSQIKASLASVIDSALSARPDFMISYISFPNTEFGIPGHYLLLMNGTSRFAERLSELVVVNEVTGSLTKVIELPLYLKLVLLSEPLHFGDYGGLALKIIWALFTLCSLIVAGLGVVSFFKKRSKSVSSKPSSLRSVISSQKKPHDSQPSSPYVWPVLLAVLAVVSLFVSLLTTGFFGGLALLILALPLALIFFKGNKNV